MDSQHCTDVIPSQKPFTLPYKLRRLVIQRAAGRCEHCGLSQEGQEATFHIDHVVPVAAGGQTVAENLALACVSCSLRKAARQTAIDPKSGKEVALYNPRRDTWHEHFRWGGWITSWVSIIAIDRSGTLLCLNIPLCRQWEDN